MWFSRKEYNFLKENAEKIHKNTNTHVHIATMDGVAFLPKVVRLAMILVIG